MSAIAKEASALVSIEVGGETRGLATEKLAAAVMEAIELKHQIKSMENLLNDALERVKVEVKKAGLSERPLHLVSDIGKVSLTRGPSVSIADLEGAYGVMGKRLLKLISARPKADLIELVCDADNPIGTKLRSYCTVKERESISVRIKR